LKRTAYGNGQTEKPGGGNRKKWGDMDSESLGPRLRGKKKKKRSTSAGGKIGKKGGCPKENRRGSREAPGWRLV